MYKTSKYTPTDKMSYLICDNYTLLQVMSRFDLSLGFGDKTVPFMPGPPGSNKKKNK